MRASIAWVALLVALVLSQEQARASPTCGTAIYNPPSAPASCATYSNFLPDGSMGFCAGIVNYPYYLPAGVSQVNLESQIALKVAAQSASPAAALLPSLPAKCLNHMKRQACLSAFMACEYVDPFWADTTCGTGQCVKCGSAASITGPTVLPPAADPVYGSVCTMDGGATFTTARSCVAGPGKVPGMGDIGWASVKALTAPTATMGQFCAAKGLVWNNVTCLTAIPRSPCRSGVCNPTSRMDGVATSDCPIITGLFPTLLVEWMASNDPYVVSQAGLALSKMTPTNRVDISVLGLLGVRPNCTAPLVVGAATYYQYSEMFTMQQYGGAPTAALGASIYGKALAYKTPSSDTCQCSVGLLNMGTGVADSALNCPNDQQFGYPYCDILANTTALCNSASGTAYPAPGMAVTAGQTNIPELCMAHITHPNAQPSAQVLAGLTMTLGNASTSVIYVPSAPGLPQFAGQFPQPLNSEGKALCSTRDPVKGTLFTGETSLECIKNRATAAYNLVPGFIDPECQVAYKQFLCASAFMKLDYKSICLDPAGCGPSPEYAVAMNLSIPFNLALPRFPSYEICTNVHNKCGAFKAILGEPGTAKRDAFEANLNCTKTVVSKCSDNADGWNSSVWKCDNSLPARQYPENGGQIMANLYTPLKTYLDAVGISNTTALAWGFAHAMNETIAPFVGTSEYANGLCSCPSPLLIPDDESAPTLSPGLCCAMRCTGYMYEDATFEQFISIQTGLSAASLALASLVFVTFAALKRSGLIIYFSFCVMMIALVMLVPNSQMGETKPYESGSTFCKDNTQPNTQAEGGACLFQGAWMTYWVLAAVGWWFTQTIELYFRVAKPEMDTSSKYKFYHMWAWGLPFLPIIVFLATGAYGYSSGNTWCMLADGPNANNLELGLFYGLIVIQAALGFLVINATLYSVCKQGSSLANQKAYLAFAMAFLFIFSLECLIRLVAAIQEHHIVDGAKAWAACLVTNTGAGVSDAATNPDANNAMLEEYGREAGTGCGSMFPIGLSVSGGTFNAVISYTNGFVIFVIFFPEMMRLWKAKLSGEDTVADSSAPSTKKADAQVAAYMQEGN